MTRCCVASSLLSPSSAAEGENNIAESAITAEGTERTKNERTNANGDQSGGRKEEEKRCGLSFFRRVVRTGGLGID